VNETNSAPKISWDWGNEVLYRMCREEPLHKDRDIIAGKLWLIGRAYAAQIERRAGKIGESDAIYAEVASSIAQSGDLDRWLESVSHINRVDVSNLHLVLATHQRFTLFLKRITKLERRSFASKYLHFHNPLAFFIYDTRASYNIRRTMLYRRFDISDACTECDREYAAFVLRCIAYRDDNAQALTPRQLDAQLLGY